MLEDNIPIHDIKSDISKLIDKVEDLEQKIINLNAKVNSCCKPKKSVKRVKVKTNSKVPVITGDKDTDALLEDEREAQEKEINNVDS